MRYNTGNPVGSDGSSSPFDLNDNAGIIDLWANDRSKRSVPDRLGAPRKTVFGLEQQVNDFLANQGYEPVVLNYVDGQPLVVERSTQLLMRENILYSARLPATFPVVLSGDWLDDQAELVTQVDRDFKVRVNKEVIPVSENIIVKIPSDYPDIQSALDDLYTKGASKEFRVDVVVESGHRLKKGFRIIDKDLSFVTIKSVDSVVYPAADFEHASNSDIGLDQIVARTSKIGFLSIRSRAPVWDILVDMESVPTVYGYVLNAGSYGYIRSFKGVVRTSDPSQSAGSNIIVAGNSTLDAMHAYAYDSLVSAITVTHRSNANIAELVATGTTGIGIDVSRGSTVYANLSNVSGREYGIDARRCFLAAQGAIFSGCTSAAIRASLDAKVVAVDAVITGSTPAFNFIMPEGGADISVTNATVNGVALNASHVYQAGGVNKVTGRGIVFNQNQRDSHPIYLMAGGATRQSSGSLSVAATSFAMAFSRTDTGYFAGGVIYGNDVGFRLTCDGSVLIEDVSRVIGGTSVSVAFVPPFTFASSCTLEVYNRASVTANVAYRLTEYR